MINTKIIICLLCFLFTCNTPNIFADYVKNELICSANSLEEAEQIANKYNLELKSFSNFIAVFKTSEISLINNSFFCENRIYTKNDTETLMNELQYYHYDIDTSKAFEYTTGEQVVVAVIDTGVDINHIDLIHSLSEKSYNSYTQKIGILEVDDDDGHGTHISGIISANLYNNSGVYGVSPNVELMVIKADRPSDNKFELSSLLRAINYAVENGANIINMSLGVSYSLGELELEKIIIENAVNLGVTIICASGNENENHANYPAAYSSTIAVSALKQNFEFDSSYSNYGPEIDISAQGTDIYSTYLDNSYISLSGTSMASPIVCAVTALIKSLNPHYTPEEIKNILCNTAKDAGDLGYDEYYGYGVINAYSAVLGSENLYNVKYFLNDTDYVETKIEGTIIKPNDLQGDYDFLGWSLSKNGEELFNFTTLITEDITLYPVWDKLGYIEGNIISYNPMYSLNIQLIQDDTIKYSYISNEDYGYALVEQTFFIKDIQPGLYQMKISKELHTDYIIKHLYISSNGVSIPNITLLCGDINGDNEINQNDLNILWLPSNYNKTLSNANSITCDLNGDGEINQNDLNILWLPINYNKGCIIIDIYNNT